MNIFKPISFVLPFLTTFFAVLLTFLPYNMGVLGIIRVDVALIVICYWIIARPSSMRFVYLTLLGLISDVLGHVTLGTHSFVYLLAWVITIYGDKQRLFQSFYGWWLNIWIIIGFTYLTYGFEKWFVGVSHSYGFEFVLSAGLTMGASLILISIFDIISKYHNLDKG